MKTATLKLTSAIGIAGVLCRAGEIVTVPEEQAKNLLNRGKAELATAEDEAELPDEELEASDEAGEAIEAPKRTASKSKK